MSRKCHDRDIWRHSETLGLGGLLGLRACGLLSLTEVAGEGGTDCPPQKFLSSQKFRHLMG